MALLLAALDAPCFAHESRPLYIELRETVPQYYSLQWKIPASVPQSNSPSVALPQTCQPRTRLTELDGRDGVLRRMMYHCPAGLAGEQLTIAYPRSNPSVSSLIRFHTVRGEHHLAVLGPQESSWRIPDGETASGVAREYTLLGIEHIWAGVDHLLFLACLLWIAGTLRRILITVTGFTLAHSATLILSALNVLRLPVPPVEAAIALSIVFLASELVKGPRESLIWRYPIAVSSSFGLLHGFGFAAALSEIGLPQTALFAGLLFFNIGVEIGQMMFVAAVIALMRGRVQAPNLRRVAGYAVGALAVFWMIEPARGATLDPPREAYFGELHLHTSYSFDISVAGPACYASDPDTAYRYAKGEAIASCGRTFRRTTPPLDFMAVTDHAEMLGVARTLNIPNSALARSVLGKAVNENRSEGVRDLLIMWFARIGIYESGRGAALASEDTEVVIRSAWQREIDAANRHYRPGRFTTFIGYEWSAHAGEPTLHRNVIFRGAGAPRPFSAQDSLDPEKLWSWLDAIRKQGHEALAIPHNPNLSDGLMFDWTDSNGRPIDRAYAKLRAANEPLVEIAQIKGQSETHPGLSTRDEFADFEISDALPLTQTAGKLSGSYVRDALGRGLEIATRTGGANPFKYGLVGGSDAHDAMSDSSERALADTMSPENPHRMRLSLRQFPPPRDARKESPARTGRSAVSSPSLTGVWAEQNTRESIYAALRRRETFATSGTRMKVRFFGGWTFNPALMRTPRWEGAAYAQGVPMGGDLPMPPPGARAPVFVVWARKDPDGANLDRIQIVKVSLERGMRMEHIFNVAFSGERASGAAELGAVWRDPDFDPRNPAVYYVRALELPTSRWTTIQSAKERAPLPAGVPATIQERAWSSPIWFTPLRASD